jgi:hypothetical protein
MKRYLIFFILCLSCAEKPKAQEIDSRVLTTAAMQQDFSYLRKILEETHPGLYAHQSKQVMQHKMDSLYAMLNTPMPFYHFYGIIANLISEIQCEHTSCTPYKDEIFQAKGQQYKLIPFVFYFNDYKAYVAINRTKDAGIHVGDEIVSINKHPIDSIEKVLFKYIPVEAGIITSREHLLSNGMTFNILYYLFIERQDAFDIVFRSANGELKERHFANELTLKENDKYILGNAANKKVLTVIAKNSKEAKDPWSLGLIKDKQTAVLTVREFSGNKKKMYDTFAEAFATLKRENIANLIIDLSYNPGGDAACAAELFGYLISKPTKFMKAEYVITDRDDYLKLSNLPAEVLSNKQRFLEPEKDGKFMVREETQGELPIVEPKPTRFTGKVYFCVNGATASAASTLAAVVKSNNLGILVGEETGGSFFGGGASVGLKLILPNSGIRAHTSIVYSVFATQGNYDKNRGVLPDHHFTPTFGQLLSGNKSWIDFTLDLIMKK